MFDSNDVMHIDSKEFADEGVQNQAQQSKQMNEQWEAESKGKFGGRTRDFYEDVPFDSIFQGYPNKPFISPEEAAANKVMGKKINELQYAYLDDVDGRYRFLAGVIGSGHADRINEAHAKLKEMEAKEKISTYVKGIDSATYKPKYETVPKK
jgi:hypothetical protein